MIDSALNTENMPLVSTAIRMCFWGCKCFWLDRNRELSRPFRFPGPNTPLPSLLKTSSERTLNFFRPVSLIQIFPWPRTQMGLFSDPGSPNVCELRETEAQSDLQSGAGKRAIVKGPWLFSWSLPCFKPMSVYCYCLVSLLMLDPFPHHKCERKPGKRHHSESSESIMDSSWDTARHLLDIWRRCPSCLKGVLTQSDSLPPGRL